ncbi:MAG: hypothetical protein H6708_08725 [Kofleriaceae bacterium]|nr:hypothetical protein [Myxococcales bacterium]MCB9560481.1 hypothetical protein [Kofleriaceae bacterium]
MADTPENIASAELLRSIADRRIRRKVQKLLQLGEEAVRALGELDAALYIREDGEEQLQIVADAVLSHLRRLLEYLGMVASPAEASEEAAGEPDLDDVPSRRSERTLARKAALGVTAVRDKSDDEKWAALAGEMDSLQYGLTSELREFDRRFADALSHDRKEQALVDINDATTALMDGVFAVMTTVYECFLGHAEPERMIPGHRDTLGKALAVRRAIAELRRTVRHLNGAIQDRGSDPNVAETHYHLVVEAMVAFIASDVFFYLRSDTRKEFERFRELLATGSAARNRLDCEGFDKYLDSLAFVSQRGVLIKHDTDLKLRINAELERALTYAALLPELVCEVFEQAFVKAERLLGLNDQIDVLVVKWMSLTADQRIDPDEAVPLARALCELVRPPPTSAPDAGDFF